MKRIIGKIPAIIAIILGLVCFGYLIASEVVAKNPALGPQPSSPAITPEHACFATCYILSVVSVFPFVVEGTRLQPSVHVLCAVPLAMMMC